MQMWMKTSLGTFRSPAPSSFRPSRSTVMMSRTSVNLTPTSPGPRALISIWSEPGSRALMWPASSARFSLPATRQARASRSLVASRSGTIDYLLPRRRRRPLAQPTDRDSGSGRAGGQPLALDLAPQDRQDVGRDPPTFFDVRKAGQDQLVHADAPVAEQLVGHLLGVADDRRAAVHADGR